MRKGNKVLEAIELGIKNLQSYKYMKNIKNKKNLQVSVKLEKEGGDGERCFKICFTSNYPALIF